MLNLLILAAAAGCMLHQVVKRIELDKHPLSFLGALIVNFWLLLLGFRRLGISSTRDCNPYTAALLVNSTILLSLWTNILIYRAFFHPLNDFPGPFGGKLSKFWAISQVIKSGNQWYLNLVKLQREYGDIVRTGPRELTLFDASYVDMLYGYSSKTRKGPFYSGLEQSLHTTRDQEFHKQRRKVWDLAFKNTLADYGPSIEDFTSMLLKRIGDSGEEPVSLNDLCVHYAYDVMSLLAYGESTNFLDGKPTAASLKVLKGIRDGIAAVGLLIHIPWVLTIAESMSFAGPMKEFNDWSALMVNKREKMSNARPDIMGHLLKHTEATPSGRALLNADSRVIIGAGSDTTASALTIIFMLLALHKVYQQRLVKEVRECLADKSYNSAKPQPLIDAVITEAMRLYPPVTFSQQRVTPAGGMYLGKIFIPEDTVVSISTYSIQRDARNFVRSDEFIPDRWTSQPELVLNKTAFIPFSTGPYGCIGKGLAMMELRSVVSRTVAQFDVSIPDIETFDQKVFFGGIKDHFTIGVPECQVQFRKRKSL